MKWIEWVVLSASAKVVNNTSLWKKHMEKVHRIKNVWQVKRKISLYILICSILSFRPTSSKSHDSRSFHKLFNNKSKRLKTLAYWCWRQDDKLSNCKSTSNNRSSCHSSDKYYCWNYKILSRDSIILLKENRLWTLINATVLQIYVQSKNQWYRHTQNVPLEFEVFWHEHDSFFFKVFMLQFPVHDHLA